MILKNKFFARPFIYLRFALLILIFVTSCAVSVKHQGQTEATDKASTVLPSITATTNQPTIISELAPTKINTPIPMTVTSLPTTMPIPGLTPIPTLSIEQKATLEARERLVQELIQMNGNCQLPCWWGIELGESLESIEEEFINHGISLRYMPSNFSDIDEQGYVNLGYYNPTTFGYDEGYVNLGYYNPTTFGYDVSITVNFHPVDGQVQFIDVLAERPLRQYGEEELVRDWEKYALSSILQQYGKPPYVYLIPQNVADPGPPNFVLILYYPDMGFKFSYQPHNALSNETQTEFCFNLENMRQINLSLYNPEFADTWANYLLPPALNPEAESYFEQLTWEAQTGMDLDMFYEIYRDSK